MRQEPKIQPSTVCVNQIQPISLLDFGVSPQSSGVGFHGLPPSQQRPSDGEAACQRQTLSHLVATSGEANLRPGPVPLLDVLNVRMNPFQEGKKKINGKS